MQSIRISTCAVALALLLAGQSSDPKWLAIRGKMQGGQKITEDERDYYETAIEHKNQEESAKRHADFAKAHPARESTGLVPLPDLGKGMYEGEQGGLYPGGVNTMPDEHLKAGLRIATSIVPLDRDGNPATDGRIVFCAIGMSNTTQETRSFLKIAAADATLNPKFTLVDCAQGAQSAEKIQKPDFPYWKLVAQRLANAGVTAKQVQVVWMKEADGNPTDSFNDYVKRLAGEEQKIIDNLRDKFPNLKIVYVSPRIYGGWAGSPLNPEPYAYASGFSVKRVVAERISKGEDSRPWVAWGPYLWADGLKGRKQNNLVWKREDVGPDGTHPSILGREKVAHLLMAFLKQDPTAKPWFLRR